MISSLHQYIGRSIQHEGKTCRLIEILEAEQAMVFVCPESAPVIQANQYGEAGRHAPQTWTVPLLSEIGKELHPVAKQVFPQDIQDSLLASLLDSQIRL